MQIGGSQISANSTADYTFPVEPLSATSRVVAHPSGALDSSWQGLLWHAWVSGANQITVRVANVTGSPITPVAQGFTFQVFQSAAS